MQLVARGQRAGQSEVHPFDPCAQTPQCRGSVETSRGIDRLDEQADALLLLKVKLDNGP
jgi:hypothetical protein